jgi:3-oxoacid CoA-transferase subunit B
MAIMQKLTDELIALRASKEITPGIYVNLGAGIPLLVGMYVDPDQVVLVTENGIMGYGPLTTEPSEMDGELVNALGQPVLPWPGMSSFDMCTALAIIRRGDLIDLAIMGGFQVSEKGDLANWNVPGWAGNIGGAMDVAIGCRRLVVLMNSVTKKGEPRLVKECSYPLTAKRCVNRVITDIAVIDVTSNGMVLKEVVHGITPEEVQAVTEAKLIIAKDLKEVEL